jgi:hypothetical protein
MNKLIGVKLFQLTDNKQHHSHHPQQQHLHQHQQQIYLLDSENISEEESIH